MGITIKSTLEYLKDFDSYSPYQEAINKVSAYIEQMQADYEARLKADMVAMLTEIQLEIGELPVHVVSNKNSIIRMEIAPSAEDVYELIQDKINTLRGEENEHI